MSYANMDGVPTQTAGVSELLASDWNTYVRDNFDSIKFGHIVCTSSTRPTSIAEGTMIYETDTNKVLVYDGSAWRPTGNVDIATSSSRPGTTFEGQMLYETDTNKVLVYNGSAWIEINDLDNPGYINDNLYARIRRLGFETRTSNYTASGTTHNNAANIFSSNITFTADGTSAYRAVFWSGRVDTIGTTVDIFITFSLDSAETGRLNLFDVGERMSVGYYFEHYFTPSAGSRTVNFRAYCPFAGSDPVINGGAGTGQSDYPMFMAVYGPGVT